MINHIYTLLLNVGPQTAGLPEPISADFRPVVLDEQLTTFHRYLLRDLPVVQQAQLVHNIMRILHAPDLAPITLQPDSRYTYALGNARSLPASVSTTFQRGGGCNFELKYNLYPDNPLPSRYARGGVFSWQLIKPDISGNQFEIKESTQTRTATILMSNGRSQAIPIIQDVLYVYFTSATSSVSGSFTGTVTVELSPVFDAKAMLADLGAALVQPGVARRLFQLWHPYEDTINALKLGWHQGVETHIQLGSLILAYAYQCEGLRLGARVEVRESTIKKAT